jgi:hypothetical protein
MSAVSVGPWERVADNGTEAWKKDLYHQAWQDDRAEEKFDRALEMSKGSGNACSRSR